MKAIENKIIIASTSERVWKCLTHIPLMKQWLGEEQMNIEVNTNWQLGSPVYIRGFHHVQFEVKGKVLEFKAGTELSYTHLSSVSNLRDEECNYTRIKFLLIPVAGGIELNVQLSNFPTESIYKHLHFYWMTTLNYIKVVAERADEA